LSLFGDYFSGCFFSGLCLDFVCSWFYSIEPDGDAHCPAS
jgi:hypothetical protein